MKKYVALLRGINVGGNKKVEMSKLKKAFEDMEYQNVSTYINSGNVIFEGKDTNISKIEAKLKKTFDFPIQVLVCDAKTIEKIVQEIPKNWQNDKEQKTDILFLREGYDTKKSLSLIESNPRVDTLVYINDAIVWHINRKNYNKSGMNTFIGTELYKNMTARNINTVRKLAKLMK